MDFIHKVTDIFRLVDPVYCLVILFSVSLLLDWLAGRRRRTGNYQLHDSFSSITIGLISFFADFLFSLLSVPLLQLLYDRGRLLDLPMHSHYVFFVLFILIDFSEYWFHRLSHEVNFLWTAHVVHHQSPFFNLLVGFRTSPLIPIFNIAFYALFPLLGFHPDSIIAVILLQGTWQLLVHTEFDIRLGWLEHLLVTPSAHRVHHGSNEIYLDKNYGKFFIIWDKCFGTWQVETEPVEYGLTGQEIYPGLVRPMIQPVRDLVKSLTKSTTRQEKRKLLFGSPAALKNNRKVID